MKTRPSLPFLSCGLLPMSCAAALMLTLPPLAHGQNNNRRVEIPGQTPSPKAIENTPGGGGSGEAHQNEETRFDLDFSGGTIQQFIDTVQAASKEPFNVIIPEDGQDLKIQPVKVRQVQLSSLLRALSASSRKTVMIQRLSRPNQISSPEYIDTGFTFEKSGDAGGPGVWQLVVKSAPNIPAPQAAPTVPPTVRFYALKSMLESGLKLEDLTTAVETAWSLMKVEGDAAPQLKFHEETRLLIAVGSENSVKVIDDVLKNLGQDQKSAEQERKAEEARAKAEDGERRAEEAEKRAANMEQQVLNAQRRAEDAEQRALEMQERAKEVERRAREEQRKAEEEHRRLQREQGHGESRSAPAPPSPPAPPVPGQAAPSPPPAPPVNPAAPAPPPVPPGVSAAAGAEAVA